MSKKGKQSSKSKSDHELSDNSALDLGGQIQEIINANIARNRRRQKQQDPESDYEYAQHMQKKKFIQLNYQRVRTEQLAKIPQLMRKSGLKLKKGTTQAEQQVIENEIRHIDPSITAVEAHAGVFAISNPVARRRIYTEGFPNSLQQDLYETNIRINNEGKLIEEKYMENNQRWDQNVNARSVEPAMNLGSKRPVITEEQQLNEIMNEGSLRQKQFLSRQLDSEFANQQQASELPQSSVFDDIPPEFTVAQERLFEQQQRQIESNTISSVNLNTVYDIGALDWGRPPINDVYGRKPFETYVAGYKYDQFCNPIAYMKKPTISIGKKGNIMKRNYIPTSQLIQTAKAQADLHKELTKSTKITKKK
ncbi:MAG: hypothetical protein EZS28_033277 [Streblomastix strix]|uniref:Uncharacterized protein n=1 Tax=Streblomastix strix TaxID=222440 RepID=A0A5J4UN57_9EUKA|nr:MAG: hypothetical protein EZS28_033277 [Streblomastix strix]